MSDIIDWHDTVRRSYLDVETAQDGIEAALPIIEQTSAAVLQRKLDSGYSLVEKPTRAYVKVVKVIESSALEGNLFPGSAYIEVRYSSKLRKIEDAS